MEQPIDIQKPTEKIYNDKAIWSGTFLGGPLVAGYLIAENFKVFNQPNKAQRTWILAIITTILTIVCLFTIPNVDKIPKQIIPILYSTLAYYFVHQYQKSNIESHLNAGGQTFNWWRAIGISLVGAIITLLPVFAYFYYTNSAINASSKTYGNLKHEILFDKDNISEREVNQIASGLTVTSFFDEVQQKSVFVKKEKKTYIIIIPVTDNSWNDAELIGIFNQLRRDIQSLFPKNKIIIDLCLDLDNIKKRIE